MVLIKKREKKIPNDKKSMKFEYGGRTVINLSFTSFKSLENTRNKRWHQLTVTIPILHLWKFTYPVLPESGPYHGWRNLPFLDKCQVALYYDSDFLTLSKEQIMTDWENMVRFTLGTLNCAAPGFALFSHSYASLSLPLSLSLTYGTVCICVSAGMLIRGCALFPRVNLDIDCLLTT